MSNCSVEGCAKSARSAGFCHAHYMRNKRHGDPNGGRGAKGGYGEAVAFVHDVALKYDGAECLTWPYSTIKGYAQMKLCGKHYLVCRYICTIVIGPPPTPEHEAAHSCGKGHEACVTKGHLSWKTPVDNAADKLVHGTKPQGERNGQAKLTESDVREIRRLCREGVSHRKIASRFGVSSQTISKINVKNIWAAVDETTDAYRQEQP